MVNIKNVQKTSVIDYPGNIASTIFFSKCPFRCSFCYNPELVLDKIKEDIPEKELLEFLEKRKKLLDGICLTGGEPMMQKDLPEFLKKVKRLGMLVKLDTNGYDPEMLKKLIDKKLVDYIAMDIKNSEERYSKTAGVKVDISKIKKSIKLIIESKVEYEFRTTVVPSLHDEKSFEDIGKMVKGAKAYYLQYFHPELELLDPRFKKVKAPTSELMEKYKKILEKYVKKVEIREG